MLKFLFWEMMKKDKRVTSDRLACHLVDITGLLMLEQSFYHIGGVALIFGGNSCDFIRFCL